MVAGVVGGRLGGRSGGIVGLVLTILLLATLELGYERPCGLLAYGGGCVRHLDQSKTCNFSEFGT